MNIKKSLNHLPITRSSSKTDKPDPIVCNVCGEERAMKFIEIPTIGNRWVHIACPCREKMWDEWKEDQERMEKNHKIRKLLRLSSSMEELKSYSWENLSIRSGMNTAYQEIRDAVDRFEERGKVGVLLFGETGNGKTHLTAAGANELLKQGYSVIFLTEKDLLTRFRESDHFGHQERFFEIMNACLEADLLVWDDFLSSQRLDAKEKDWMFQVINGRERADKPIWYTSNLTMEEFKNGKYSKYLDSKERTWWRIIGNNCCVYNGASNYRKIQAMERVKKQKKKIGEK